MKITADTNILLRSVLQDDPYQASLAVRALRKADLVAIPLPVLCEYVWVLRRNFKKPGSAIANSIEHLISGSNIAVNRPAVEAGLVTLRAGGDFADGAIAYEGNWLGAEEFASFDVKAVTLLQAQGIRTRLLPEHP